VLGTEAIVMVAIEPDYCYQCGGAVEKREIHGRRRSYCPDREFVLFRNAVPSAGVIVHTDEMVLLIERAVPPVGVWALPGGHSEYDEAQRAKGSSGSRSIAGGSDCSSIGDGRTGTLGPGREPVRTVFIRPVVHYRMVQPSESRAYREARESSFGDSYFRPYDDGVVSSIGLGTYLGEPTDAVDDRYDDAIETAIESGCSMIDTAINYRCQRSERVVGEAISASDVDREAILVATKGGFVPFDGSRPADPEAYVRSEYVDDGPIHPDELVRGRHCIAPEFLDDQLERSRENLELDVIDLYYVHNPEAQLADRSRETVYDQLEAAFELLERKREEGVIRGYGVASWECFRVPEDEPDHLSLPEVVGRAASAAERIGHDVMGLTALQLPYNVVMPEAATVSAHSGPAGPQTALGYARDLGLHVFTSASIMQGQLAASVPDDVAAAAPGESPAQQSINVARSTPGVSCSLVGSSDPAHVEENVEAGRFDPMDPESIARLFE
jgi:aryl-alcohol dehydrogenase-like predicted oxidoreductase